MTRDVTPAGWPATGAVDEAFMEVQASFDRFCLAAGIEAPGTDITAACGPRRGRDAARRHTVGADRSGAWTAPTSRSRLGYGNLELERFVAQLQA